MFAENPNWSEFAKALFIVEIQPGLRLGGRRTRKRRRTDTVAVLHGRHRLTCSCFFRSRPQGIVSPVQCDDGFVQRSDAIYPQNRTQACFGFVFGDNYRKGPGLVLVPAKAKPQSAREPDTGLYLENPVKAPRRTCGRPSRTSIFQAARSISRIVFFPALKF